MLEVIGQQVYMLRPFFSRGFSERVLLREISVPRPLLYCGMLIKPALNQYNWQKTFIQSLSFSLRYLNVLKLAPGLSTIGKNSGGARWRAFSTRDELRFLFHVFNKRWFLSMRKIIWQCFACKGQFNKSGNFSMIEIRDNLTLSNKSQREVKFEDHVFFSTFIVSWY